MKLKIYRDKWLRGEGTETSYLLRRKDKKQCCVGFYAIALGASKKDITGIKVIRDVAVDNPIWPGAMSSLYNVNDDTDISDAEREVKIKDIFARHNVEVEFLDTQRDKE